MSIALIGASGNAGSQILKELSDRGHHVTAISRHPENIAKLRGLAIAMADEIAKPTHSRKRFTVGYRLRGTLVSS